MSDRKNEADPADSGQEKPKTQPTTDPKLSDPEKTPGSGMTPDDGGEAPSG